MSSSEREAELVLRWEIQSRAGGELVQYRYTLTGRRGVIQFVYAKDMYGAPESIAPGGFEGHDIGYHSPEPLYEGATCYGDFGECVLLPEAIFGRVQCFYDGSSLGAVNLLRKILEQGVPRTNSKMTPAELLGEEVVRRHLAEEYHYRFVTSYDGPHTGEPYKTPQEREEGFRKLATDLAEATQDPQLLALVQQFPKPDQP